MTTAYEAVEAVSTYRETRSQIIEYYKALFPNVKELKNGKRIEEWKGHLAQDLEPYANLSKASLMRRFQSGRENSKLSAKGKEEYARLGDTLPPIAPKGYRLEPGSVLYIHFSEDCVKRTIKDPLFLEGAAAKAFTKAALMTGGAEQMLVNVYMKLPYDSMMGPGVCPDKEPNIILAPLHR